MACDDCRATLHRFRELYYTVDSNLPVTGSKNKTQYGKDLEDIYWRTQRLLHPNFGMTFRTSLLIFFQRTWLKWTLIIGATLYFLR